MGRGRPRKEIQTKQQVGNELFKQEPVLRSNKKQLTNEEKADEIIKTVFKELGTLSIEIMYKGQKRYDLGIPFEIIIKTKIFRIEITEDNTLIIRLIE